MEYIIRKLTVIKKIRLCMYVPVTPMLDHFKIFDTFTANQKYRNQNKKPKHSNFKSIKDRLGRWSQVENLVPLEKVRMDSVPKVLSLI